MGSQVMQVVLPSFGPGFECFNTLCRTDACRVFAAKERDPRRRLYDGQQVVRGLPGANHFFTGLLVHAAR